MQPVSHSQPPMPSRREGLPAAEPVPTTTSLESSCENKKETDGQYEKKAPEPHPKKKEPRDETLSQETLDEISKDLETLHAVGLNFTKHEGTGRTMVRITNRETEEMIREIPVKQVLDLAAKIEEMVGILFDEKV